MEKWEKTFILRWGTGRCACDESLRIMPIPGFRAKLKTENCHDANIVVIGGAEGGRNDNLWHCRRRQRWNYDNSWFWTNVSTKS